MNREDVSYVGSMAAEIIDAEKRCFLGVGDKVRLTCAGAAPGVGKPVGAVGEIVKFSRADRGGQWVWVRFSDGSTPPLKASELELVTPFPGQRVSCESAGVSVDETDHVRPGNGLGYLCRPCINGHGPAWEHLAHAWRTIVGTHYWCAGYVAE